MSKAKETKNLIPQELKDELKTVWDYVGEATEEELLVAMLSLLREGALNIIREKIMPAVKEMSFEQAVEIIEAFWGAAAEGSEKNFEALEKLLAAFAGEGAMDGEA